MIKAIIFDMDGVITDTQTIHAQIESELLARAGVNIEPEEISKRFAGVKTSEFFRDLLTDVGQEDKVDVFMQEKNRRLIDLVQQGVPTIPGAIDFIMYGALGF